jgi:hypothetical protein
MKYVLLVLGLMLTMSACTTVNVAKIDTSANPMKSVCIEQNPKVLVADFVGVVERGFLAHGIETSVYSVPLPASCEYSLTYTATRGWDLAPFMNFAELRLKRGPTTIGSATYRHAGGFGLNKWASTESKMQPVIEQLLAGYQRQ